MPDVPADDLRAFVRLIDAIRPWLGQLVIVGGWSHRLHRLHEMAHVPSYAPLLTVDADVAISRTEPLEGSVRAALLSAGFDEQLVGVHTPPIAEYRLGDAKGDFYAEFLAPLTGSGTKRSGATDATVVSGGVTAQKVRYLEVLVMQPWTVRIDAALGFPVSRPTDIRVPNAVSFIAQKLLIRAARPPKKRAQDVLYIHDTLELFGANLEELRVLWRDALRPAIPPKTSARIEIIA
ncbi:MAG TPA: GSU2403 family nucleotidyltransferase fold protein, partial [Gemmatimonadaceae bacterium]|nr:GSU2403 family nucleotidyltransferase fold protein [Gemmatimonadaceae bacterium]